MDARFDKIRVQHINWCSFNANNTITDDTEDDEDVLSGNSAYVDSDAIQTKKKLQVEATYNDLEKINFNLSNDNNSNNNTTVFIFVVDNIFDQIPVNKDASYNDSGSVGTMDTSTSNMTQILIAHQEPHDLSFITNSEEPDAGGSALVQQTRVNINNG